MTWSGMEKIFPVRGEHTQSRLEWISTTNQQTWLAAGGKGDIMAGKTCLLYDVE